MVALHMLQSLHRQFHFVRQRVERLGRRALVWCVATLFGVRVRPVSLADPLYELRILLVRVDQRVGNMVMLTPLLDSLLARFPGAHVDMVGSMTAQALFAGDPRLHAYIPFRKRALLHKDGPLRMPWRLRARHYHVAIDVSNPTDPSVTQALLVRWSGALHTVGFNHHDFGRLFSARVDLDTIDDRPQQHTCHEIDMRLRLLSPLPGSAVTRRMHLHGHVGLRALAGMHDPVWTRFCADLAQTVFAVVNIGARLPEKRLDAHAYGAMCRMCLKAGLLPILTYGPREQALAQEVHGLVPSSLCAPPTDLVQLAHVMRSARAVLTCDTGPMHIAVALETPTCGIFVSTDPDRYGYPDAPHTVLDVRHGILDVHHNAMADWLAGLA